MFGGNGNDIINATLADEIIQAGPGDDTIVVSSPDGLISSIPDLGTDEISGGSNGSQGDTLQIGTSSTQTGLTFIQQDDDNFVGLSGFENLDIFASNTTFQGSNEIFVTLDNINTTSGATNVTLKSFAKNDRDKLAEAERIIPVTVNILCPNLSESLPEIDEAITVPVPE